MLWFATRQPIVTGPAVAPLVGNRSTSEYPTPGLKIGRVAD